MTASPAYQLLQNVWDNYCNTMAHSWERLNRSMYGATRLAITAGLRFDPDDFAKIAKNFRIGYWASSTHNCGEGLYCVAATSNNRSACISFEKWKARPPYFVNGCEYPYHMCHHNWATSNSRTGRVRLARGARFWWGHYRPVVTSFRNGYVVACTYKPKREGEWSVDRVARVFKITRKELLKEHPAPKKKKVEDDRS